MRPIDADALIPKLKAIRECEFQVYGKGSWDFAGKCMVEAENAPTVESERKTGKWILACRDSATQWNRGNGTCSECKTYQFGICDDEHWQNYCGHCGAKMEGIE